MPGQVSNLTKVNILTFPRQSSGYSQETLNSPAHLCDRRIPAKSFQYGGNRLAARDTNVSYEISGGWTENDLNVRGTAQTANIRNCRLSGISARECSASCVY